MWGKVGQGIGALRAEGRSSSEARRLYLTREVGGVKEKVGLERRLNIGQDYSNIKYPSPASKSKVEG